VSALTTPGSESAGQTADGRGCDHPPGTIAETPLVPATLIQRDGPLSSERQRPRSPPCKRFQVPQSLDRSTTSGAVSHRTDNQAPLDGPQRNARRSAAAASSHHGRAVGQIANPGQTATCTANVRRGTPALTRHAPRLRKTTSGQLLSALITGFLKHGRQPSRARPSRPSGPIRPKAPPGR